MLKVCWRKDKNIFEFVHDTVLLPASGDESLNVA